MSAADTLWAILLRGAAWRGKSLLLPSLATRVRMWLWNACACTWPARPVPRADGPEAGQVLALVSITWDKCASVFNAQNTYNL